MKSKSRSFLDVQNDIIRTSESYKVVQTDDRFTETDRKILLPKYRKDLEKLEAEKHQLENDINQIVVNDPTIVEA